MDSENLKTSFHVGERNVYTRVKLARTNESPEYKERRREGGEGRGGGKENKEGGRGGGKENKEEGSKETGKAGEKKVL